VLVNDGHCVHGQMHSKLAKIQSEHDREKKQHEQLEVQCHDLKRELELVNKSGSRPSQNAETAKEVAKYAVHALLKSQF